MQTLTRFLFHENCSGKIQHLLELIMFKNFFTWQCSKKRLSNCTSANFEIANRASLLVQLSANTYLALSTNPVHICRLWCFVTLTGTLELIQSWQCDESTNITTVGRQDSNRQSMHVAFPLLHTFFLQDYTPASSRNAMIIVTLVFYNAWRISLLSWSKIRFQKAFAIVTFEQSV